ncbi:hypothetical protein QJS10_CPB14g00939 [Acorus calamus]|uniref:COI1 F-box domain-containing protein n=1 Tax=Acorus calamus TaxID=4465 RepID=A0AAV9DCN3_ACOCL|nr:hypothetical protein QJS10_CPB14g00939 [Acorus calamus]
MEEEPEPPAPHPAAQETHINELPDAILSTIISLISNTRTRNATSLVCHKWRSIERSTRTSISLRGNVRDLFRVPTSFRSVIHLDLSNLSPWGHSLLHDSNDLQSSSYSLSSSSSSDPDLIARFIHLAFPSASSISLYARDPSAFLHLSPHYPSLLHAKLLRFHQRPSHLPLGSDFKALLDNCLNLTSLDLSCFYFWTEDLPPALQSSPAAAASLTTLDLLNRLSSDGFKSQELLAISFACPNLRRLSASCAFHPRLVDPISSDTLLSLSSHCPRLLALVLADAFSLSGGRGNLDDEGYAQEDALVGRVAVEGLLASLPLLEELCLDLRQNVRDAGPAFEAAAPSKCPNFRSLKLGQFHGIYMGIAACKGLEQLSIVNSADLTNDGLVAIARGCPRLVKLEIHGCKHVTEAGVMTLAALLWSTLIDVRISCCKNLCTTRLLRALTPIRDRIQRLHIDCIWEDKERNNNNEEDREFDDFVIVKKCRYSTDMGRGWKRLRYLSIWIPVGEVLMPLVERDYCLESCPALEETYIKVEGDCRRCPKPTPWGFGLSSLERFPNLKKMSMDCGEVDGYALTAPMGEMDLSLWERFYLSGVGRLRGLKLFIHGTAHEHFMNFLLNIPNLRDVQLRDDYYPAPENDMSTEMRVDSCSRFEAQLNRRPHP